MISALVWDVSCGHAPNSKFRLAKLDGELVVLPPPYWNRPPNKPVEIAVPVPPAVRRANSAGCSIKSGPFGVAAARGSPSPWRVTLPSLTQWLEASRSDSFRKQFDDFLDEVEALERRNCIPAGTGRTLAGWARESVPVRNGDVIFYRYDGGRGQGFIDIEPRMKLGIERALYAPDGKFAGTQVTAYETSHDHAGFVKFRPMKVSTVTAVAAQDPTAPDRVLAERARRLPYYRLFYLGDFVPKDSRYEAMLVGTRTRTRMEEVTNGLRKRWESVCPAESAADPVECILFQGPVTVTAEVIVTVNGKRIFMFPRDTVGYALAETQLSGCVEKGSPLRVYRRFLSTEVPVVTEDSNSSILDLQLLAGDRISCGSN